MYCDDDCGTNWIDNDYGCQVDDAHAYCRLRYCNKNAIAESFDIVPALNAPGFACRGVGRRFARKENPYHGILDFNVAKDIKAFHGEGLVVTNVKCLDRSRKSYEKI